MSCSVQTSRVVFRFLAYIDKVVVINKLGLVIVVIGGGN